MNFREALNNKAKGTDPFSIAQDKSNGMIETSQAFDPNADSPLTAPVFPQEDKKEAKSLQDTEIEVLSQTLVPQPTKQQAQDLNESGFATFLQSQGLGEMAQGLSLTPMGRLQLIGRLKTKFGDNFLNTSQGMKIVDMFEKAISSNEKAAKKQQQTFADQANRTLDILGIGSARG